ncbi:MAG: collagen-like protein [Thermoleophilia bacterium]|nr:collagen-like protein [Thermoleophilia bacterium]
MASRRGFGGFAVAGAVAAVIAGGSAVALSQGEDAGGQDAAAVKAATATKKKPLRGPRGLRSPRGLRGVPGPSGATGPAGPAGPSSSVAVLDDSSAPFVDIPSGDENTAVLVATTQLPAGAYVIHARLGISSGTGGARVVCRLLAGTTQLDRSILTAGQIAGYVSQGEMAMMSATTLAAATQVQIRCHREGGTSDPFVYQQQILALNVGSAATTKVAF